MLNISHSTSVQLKLRICASDTDWTTFSNSLFPFVIVNILTNHKLQFLPFSIQAGKSSIKGYYNSLEYESQKRVFCGFKAEITDQSHTWISSFLTLIWLLHRAARIRNSCRAFGFFFPTLQHQWFWEQSLHRVLSSGLKNHRQLTKYCTKQNWNLKFGF